MKRSILCAVVCVLWVASGHGQTVVVNEYLNQGGSPPTPEYVELLVLQDKLDLRGYVVRDFTGAGTVGGTVTFTSDALWQRVRSGYLIVIEVGAAASSDVDFSDGLVVVGEEDATYFSTVGSFSVAGSADGVEVLDGGGGHVHALAHGSLPAGTPLEMAATTSPGAGATGSLSAGEAARFVNTSTDADFDDDARAEGGAVPSQGAPNDAVQDAFKARRLPVWINEIQADGGGTADLGEYVEIVGPAGFSILHYTVFITDCAPLTPTSATYTIDDGANTTTRSTFTDEKNGFGFYVISDPPVSVNDQDLNQDVFTGAGQSDEDLPDAVAIANTSGAVVLRDAAGNTVFAFAYGLCADFTNRIGAGVGDSSPGLSEGFLKDVKPSDADDAVKLMATPGSANDDGVQSPQTLPVELVAFEAVLDGREVRLRWRTAGETNNAGFEVQRRAAAAPAWAAAGFVGGAGTTAQPQAYAYRVAGLPPGVHRFRLKQIDYDGTVAYSPEVEVAVAVPGAYHLAAVYPNPFFDQARGSVSVARGQHVEVALFNLLGRRVRLLYAGPMAAGTTRAFTLDAAGLPGGVYLLRIEGETFAGSRRVVRLR